MGHEVTVFSSQTNAIATQEIRDGVRFVRRGGKYTVYLWAFLYYIFVFRGKFDVVVDEINTIPFLTPLYVRTPRIAFIHQVAADVIDEAIIPTYQRKLIKIIEPRLLRVYSRTSVVARSNSTRSSLVDFGIPFFNVSICLPGINVQDGKIEVTKLPYVLYLGRVVPQKGLSYLFRAFKMASETHPELKLLIAGRAEGNYDQYLLSLAKSLGVAEKVLFVGRVDEKMKTELMRRAMVFVMYSIREGWGLSVLEAMRLGTIPIVSDVPGLSECVDYGRMGLLLPRGDIPVLAENISYVVDMASKNPDEYANFAKKISSYAKNFTWDDSAKTFANILRHVAN